MLGIFKRPIQVDDPELIESMASFMGAFQYVFRDDWEYTKMMMGDEEEGMTFLEPGLEDECEDWGGRGRLLECYRNLIKLMKARGIEASPPFPGV